MSHRHKPREQVFAVVRYDAGPGEPADRITVKEVVRTQAAAEAEVARLAALNAHLGSVYFWTPTRLFGPGVTAGPPAPGPSAAG